MTGNYVFETGCTTGILGQLKWESLKKRRKDSRLILLYRGLKGKARIPTDDLVEINTLWLFRYLQLAKKRTKVVSFHRISGTGMTSLIPDSLISSAEMSDDCVPKSASLVRARD